MKGILSQSEIDDLIKSVTAKDVDLDKLKDESRKNKVRTYDFKKPNKFTHEQVKFFNSIFNDFAKYLTMDISDRYRTDCLVETVFVDEQTFYEYTNSIGKTSVIGVVHAQPMKGSLAIELTNKVATVLLDLILGGNGRVSDFKTSYTDIEIALTKNILKGFILPLKNAWETIVEITPEIGRVETSGQNLQICAPNDTIAIISLKITIGSSEGIVNCTIPYNIVEPYIKKMNNIRAFNSHNENADENNEEIMKKAIKDEHIEIICELGKTYLTMDEINMMQAGDVIKINKEIGEPAEILYNDVSKHKVDIGVRNGKYAARIINEKEGILNNG